MQVCFTMNVVKYVISFMSMFFPTSNCIIDFWFFIILHNIYLYLIEQHSTYEQLRLLVIVDDYITCNVNPAIMEFILSDEKTCKPCLTSLRKHHKR